MNPVTITITVSAEVDELIRRRWPNPEKYLAGVVTQAANEEKKRAAAEKAVLVAADEVSADSDSPLKPKPAPEPAPAPAEEPAP